LVSLVSRPFGSIWFPGRIRSQGFHGPYLGRGKPKLLQSVNNFIVISR
jgi:hypothetical protein